VESGGRKKPGVLRFDRVTAKSAMSLVQSFFLRHSVYDGIADPLPHNNYEMSSFLRYGVYDGIANLLPDNNYGICSIV